MTEQEFLEHHQLLRHPFVDEDAQTDSVFKEFCIAGTFHPAWSKVAGSPTQPATAVVFGPKGSGKTAMRLQLIRSLSEHNLKTESDRVFLVEYDDFNAYLGPFQEHLPHRYRNHPERVLQSLRLWDHMDAIMSQAVTNLVNSVLGTRPNTSALAIDASKVQQLDRGQRRDLLLLAAAYDHSSSGSFQDRFLALKKRLKFHSSTTWAPLAIGIVGTLLSLWCTYWLYQQELVRLRVLAVLAVLMLIASWGAYAYRFVRMHWLARRVCKNLRVIARDRGQLRQTLMTFRARELDEQPLPASQRSDDRYALLEKLQLLLRSLGYPSMIVIVDRVDEPDLINGMAERMKLLVWPLLDNKLLKHENFGIKMLLPSDLQSFVDRESREFHERARLDKQNVVTSFEWTGEALYDLITARMRACSSHRDSVRLGSLFQDTLSDARLVSALQSLGTPRHAFRFLYHLITEHCKRFRSDAPSFQIASELFESTLAVYLADGKRR